MADIKEIGTEQGEEQIPSEETKEPTEPADATEAGEAADNGKLSSKSSDISIEEIGAEESNVEKSDNAEILIPEVEEEVKEIVLKEASPPEDVEEDEDEEDDDDFEDETLVERIIGLSEMFPDGLTSLVTGSAKGLVSGAHWAYGAGRTLTWIVCSSATLMFLPIMIESERLGLEEAQKNQQRQMLLGPGAAMSGTTKIDLYLQFDKF